MEDKVLETVEVLCNWIQVKCKNGTSDKELESLPEVINATANLLKARYS